MLGRPPPFTLLLALTSAALLATGADRVPANASLAPLREAAAPPAVQHPARPAALTPLRGGGNASATAVPSSFRLPSSRRSSGHAGIASLLAAGETPAESPPISSPSSSSGGEARGASDLNTERRAISESLRSLTEMQQVAPHGEGVDEELTMIGGTREPIGLFAGEADGMAKGMAAKVQRDFLI